VREIRMRRARRLELETELGDGLRHRHVAKAAGKRLLPGPTATAPALDPTRSNNLCSPNALRIATLLCSYYLCKWSDAS
jgi:hypothetical protein